MIYHKDISIQLSFCSCLLLVADIPHTVDHVNGNICRSVTENGTLNHE